MTFGWIPRVVPAVAQIPLLGLTFLAAMVLTATLTPVTEYGNIWQRLQSIAGLFAMLFMLWLTSQVRITNRYPHTQGVCVWLSEKLSARGHILILCNLGSKCNQLENCSCWSSIAIRDSHVCFKNDCGRQHFPVHFTHHHQFLGSVRCRFSILIWTYKRQSI
jgi:hypothetical protein